MIGVNPIAVDQESVLRNLSYRRFEMQATLNVDTFCPVSIRTQNGCQLLDPRLVTTLGNPGENIAAIPQHIATIQTTWRCYMSQLPGRLQTSRDRGGLRFARFGSRPGDHGQLIEDDSSILNENRIG